MNKPDIDPVTRHCSACDGIHYGDTGDCVYKRTPMPTEKPTAWPDSPAEKMRMEAHNAAIVLSHTGDYGPVFRTIDALADALKRVTQPTEQTEQFECWTCTDELESGPHLVNAEGRAAHGKAGHLVNCRPVRREVSK